jgi:hypothetical protein
MTKKGCGNDSGRHEKDAKIVIPEKSGIQENHKAKTP